MKYIITDKMGHKTGFATCEADAVEFAKPGWFIVNKKEKSYDVFDSEGELLFKDQSKINLTRLGFEKDLDKEAVYE
jgi:hypothetical protein